MSSRRSPRAVASSVRGEGSAPGSAAGTRQTMSLRAARVIAARWLGRTTLTRRRRFCPASAASSGPVNRPRRMTATCSAAANRVGVADDHHAYQRLIDALRETPFWDRYFEVVDLLVGTENGATPAPTASNL
ncbi:darcynin family protein [Nocardia salmonicida]